LVTYTSSSLYWSPLKPRINIYAFSDSSYSSPIYTYNAFTDAGSTTKPISLNFDSETTNVGTFSIEIEDTGYELDPDTFMRGNRIFIECSKDGSTWQPAFKGLARSSDQNIYATTGRNFTINGYSYLVRLNERVLNTIKESALVGEDYDRTDSNMFTDNLINDLLTTNSNYVYSDDDTALYSIFKKTNITSSPITDWIPRLDAQLVTVNDAINSVLEFSNGLLMINPADDELILYNPDLVTSATSIFLLTNQMNQAADDADYTMYPLEPYRYNISYDYPDSGSRLIGSIGSGGEPCPDIIDTPETPCTSINASDSILIQKDEFATVRNLIIASEFKAEQTDMSNFSITVSNFHDISAVPDDAFKLQVRTKSGASHPNAGSQIGSTEVLYWDRDDTKGLPDFTNCNWLLGLPTGVTGPTGLSIGTTYWAVIYSTTSGSVLGNDSEVRWAKRDVLLSDSYMNDFNETGWPNPASANWAGTTGDLLDSNRNGPFTYNEMSFGDEILSEECGGGGTQATIDADPVFAVAHDRNMSNRLGIVERVISDIPTHIKKAQTLNEYLYNKLYYAAKPRFTFDFPSVTMPNRIPKAGDIVAHVDSKARVGTIEGAVQTGVISSVGYTFDQGQDDVLGLRRLSLSTTGIRRGSY
jgi:hypothetical protein